MQITKKHIIPYLNLVLSSVAIILIFWTWVKFLIATVDTIFGGLFIIGWFIVTVYYLLLLFIALKLLNIEKHKTQLINIFLMIALTLPMIMIYTWIT